ncbi:MAG: hypothetical protein H9917_03390 [Candidatus Oceanisphaera merdipullorum]|nr:hypothetical protein [Candidatus Oceanisphaera merdipullorum]
MLSLLHALLALPLWLAAEHLHNTADIDHHFCGVSVPADNKPGRSCCVNCELD